MTWAVERGCRAQPRRQGSEPGSAVLPATVTLCTGQLPAFPGGPLCATTNEPVPSTGVVQGGGAYSAQGSLPVLRGASRQVRESKPTPTTLSPDLAHVCDGAGEGPGDEYSWRADEEWSPWAGLVHSMELEKGLEL